MKRVSLDADICDAEDKFAWERGDDIFVNLLTMEWRKAGSGVWEGSECP